MKLRWIIGLFAVVSIAVLIVIGKMQPVAEVTVVQPEHGAIRAWIEEQATTKLPQDVLVAMPIAGWLEPITLREGDPVAAGQVLAQLDKADLTDRVRQSEQRIAVLETKLLKTADHRLEENALVEVEATVKAIDETVKAAEAKLKAALAVRDFSAGELKRIGGLLETGSATDLEVREATMQARKTEAEYQSDALELAALKTVAAVSFIGPKFIRDYVDRKNFEAEEIKSQLVEARAGLEIEKRNLERATITSSIDGVVLARHNTRHQFLQAGTPLLTIGDLDDLEIVAEILSERALQIDVGDSVEVFGKAIPGKHIEGIVKRVYPAGFKKISSLGVEQQRVNVVVALKERPERLGVGFRVYVRIKTEQKEDVMILPRTSLMRTKDGGWQVMEVVGGLTTFQDVHVGLLNDDHVEITGGLKSESQVVAQPSSELNEGIRVRVVNGE